MSNYTSPSDLRVAGARLWTAITGDVPDEVELDARDIEYLSRACRLTDTAADLAAVVARDGIMVPTKHGIRVHPAAIELRQTEAAISRLLGLVDMDASEGSQSAKSRAARAAARKRWANAGQSRRAVARGEVS